MIKDNDLITLHVSELIFRISIPASIGFFFYTMYNVVDTWFAALFSLFYVRIVLRKVMGPFIV